MSQGILGSSELMQWLHDVTRDPSSIWSLPSLSSQFMLPSGSLLQLSCSGSRQEEREQRAKRQKTRQVCVSQGFPSDFHLYITGQNCVIWPPLFQGKLGSMFSVRILLPPKVGLFVRNKREQTLGTQISSLCHTN